MPSLPTNRREMLLTLAALLTAAFCVYANTIGNSWVYDDFPIIVNNPDIRSLSAFFDNAYPGRPLREVTYLLDFALFGQKPAGWHIQSILWHGLNAFLVFLLALRLGGARAVAWAASLLFLAHPLQVEAVAGIANRKESLALAFSLLSFLAYAEAFAPGRRKSLWVATSVALGALAFLAKEIAVALPATFFAYELAFVPREQRLLARYWRAWGVALTVGIAAFFAWYFFYGGRELFLRESVQRLKRFDYTFQAPSELAHIAMVLKSLAFMFLKFLLPLNLAADYAYPLPASWLDPWVLSGLLGLLLYGLALWFSLRRMPPVFFALVWIGAFWLPVSNLLPLGYFAADRYLYTPAAGFSSRPPLSSAGPSAGQPI